MSQEIMNQSKEKMQKAIGAFNRELASIRAGRASANVLDRITIDYYGTPTPVNQLASINIPEARLLTITPYDKSSMGDIEKALMKSDLGLTPSNDGSIIRLNFPALTEERRKELAKLVKKEAEEAKVAIRNIRRDANDDLKKSEKNGDLTEDDLRGYTEDVQKQTDDYIRKVDEIAKEKEQEIMEV
ncbi:ribosome recycling factor [Domibacillus sp. A3M-37]|nr:ribosome recycling factor [Domibacillus sp. A3M-37]MCP3762022.1 ribosome recycling factor [Domibacillus sp. A3M-37]